jgi:hypothetical protein
MKYAPLSARKGRINTSLTLPDDYFWKLLQWFTDDLREIIGVESFNRLQNITRKRDILAYMALSSEWNLQSIDSASSDDVHKHIACYCLSNLLKKYPFQTGAQERQQAAYDKFKLFERRCKLFNDGLHSELSWSDNEWTVDVFTYIAAFLKRLLGFSLPNEEQLTEWSRHGPGTSLGMKEGKTSVYHKYSDWPYTCTNDAYGLAVAAIEGDERWFGALQNSYRERYGIPIQYPLNMKMFWARVITIVDGNTITFVPKDAMIDRTIAIEPTLNLWLQLGVDGYMRRRLKRWGIDLDTQAKNQEYARLGSLDNTDDPFVTLDLEGASDSICLKLLKLVLPDEWYQYLCRIRSKVGSYRDETFVYSKVSSMGNGFTFALESALFSSIIWAVKKADGLEANFDDVCVYGDDIIVRRSIAYKVIELLRLCGFTINSSKSFLFGKVRESCGADWFQGTPCRPVYIKKFPSSVMDLWSDVNRLQRLLYLRWYILPDESKLISCMEKWIPESFRSFIGPYSDIEFDCYRHSLRKTYRWRNCLLHYRRLVIKPIPQVGRDFLFRKIMHDLRPSTPESEMLRISGAGSRFTVTHRKKLTVGAAYSATSYWQSEYNEVRPI